MAVFKRTQILSWQTGLLFREGEFAGLLEAGKHTFFDPFDRIAVSILSRRNPDLFHEQLDVVLASGMLDERVTVVDLKQNERAIVWIDDRFHKVLGPGRYAFWNDMQKVTVETFDTADVRLTHSKLQALSTMASARSQIEFVTIDREHSGVLFVDGRYSENLSPGLYAFWKGAAQVRVAEVDLRETMVDVSGQEIMTADKVTLRMNAVVTYRIEDARKAVTLTDDAQQSLYREMQLVLRGVVGTRELEVLLTDKDAVADEIMETISKRAAELGLRIASVGVRDIILPGDMKELLNRVTEARKAAEANLIMRREETAAMRSQANTAKLLADNPVLMRLRELEVLEKIAADSKLNVILGEQGLADKVMNLL